MTGRTHPPRNADHGLTVIEGGLQRGAKLDELDAPFDAAWLAREMAAASRLGDQLAAEGKRIAFEPRGNGARGVQVSVRDLIHDHLVRDLDSRDAVDVGRLIQLNGMGG